MNSWNKTKKSIANGFTLIEVLIALVVAVVGILAMIQLSGAFLKTASESDQRAVATTLAERQLETLRGFDALSGSSADESYFSEISSSTASASVVSGSATFDFDLAWNVVDYVGSGAGFTQSSSGALYNMYKDVTVVVSWTEPRAGSVALSSIIAGIDPDANALALNDTDVGGEEPEVTHNLGVAPDVIPIQVGDKKFKETSKPLPDVSQHGKSTRVDFEVVTYDTSDGDVKEIREEFSTINCQCEYGDGSGSLTGSGETPTYYTWSATDKAREAYKGRSKTKVVGHNNLNEQDDLCDRCCRDHHDSISDTTSSAEQSVSYDPWRSASTGYVSSSVLGGYDHKHYDVTGLSEVPPVVGDTYIEACRFKRIDGIFYLMQDWRLIDINVMKRDELAVSSAISNYGSYVQKVVAEYIDESSSPNWTVDGYYTASSTRPTYNFFTENPLLSASVAVTAGSTTQLMARSIYMEEMDLDHKLYIQTIASGGVSSAVAAVNLGDSNWLPTVPFYEINTTLLADWLDEENLTTDPSNDIDVTSETIETIVDPDNNYYGSYSRGAVLAGTNSASEAVFAYSELSNTSLTGSTPIDVDDDSQKLSASLDIYLDTSSAATTFSGFFDCVAINPTNGNNQKCSGTDYTGITVQMVPAANSSCGAITVPQGNASAVFTCTYVGASSWSGDLRFTHSDNTFTFSKADGALPPGTVVWDDTNKEWVATAASSSTSLNVKLTQ
jgi:type IV pilus modification protein PilV